MEIPDLHPAISLPASGEGFQISTLSSKEWRYPEAVWNEKKKRGIILFSEDWAKLKFVLLKNCLSNKCRQSVGALDNLFYALDDGFKSITPK